MDMYSSLLQEILQNIGKAKKELAIDYTQMKNLVDKHFLSRGGNDWIVDNNTLGDVHDMLSDDGDSNYLIFTDCNPPKKCMDLQSSRTNKGNGCSLDSEDPTDELSQELRPPEKFICPLTKKVMSDPVILSSGKTVEREFIEAFFRTFPSCRKCPVTKTEDLPSHELTPDDALRTEIKRWQESNSMDDERRAYFIMLLRRLAYPGEDQLVSAAELGALAYDFPFYAKVFYDIGPSAVLELARPLLSKESVISKYLHEDIIVTFRLLAKQNKKISRYIMDHPDVVNLIAESLRTGSLETRCSAATLAYYISADLEGRKVLYKLGVTKHLVELVEEGNLLLLNDVVRALLQLNLCSQRVIDGIMSAILKNLEDENKISYLECLMNNVLKDTVVWKHVAEAEVLYHELLEILIDSKSDAVKAFCVAVLLEIVQSSNSALLATRNYEKEHNVITQIVEEGTPQAKKNAIELRLLLDGDKAQQTAATETELESMDVMDSHKPDHLVSDEVHLSLDVNEAEQTAATETHKIELESVDVMGSYKPDHTASTEVHFNELKSADANAKHTHKVDHMEETTEINPDELLDLLQETECEDVMEIWVDALLRLVERNEAALIATWRRQMRSYAITRVQKMGNVKTWHTAEKIFRLLETVHPDQIQPDT